MEPTLPDPEKFNQQVWALVRQIPYGRVFTYGQIAARLACPPGMAEKDWQAYRARWVGSAMSQSPDDVPWQRVINSQGKISFKPGSRTGDLQRRLLEAEGVAFDEKGRTDLARFGWQGPPGEWLEANGYANPEEPPRQGALF